MASCWRQAIRIVEDSFADPENSEIEVVERKGIGHPDSLAELVADAFIRCYAKFALSTFGVVPNVSVDKTTLIGALATLRPGSHVIERGARALLVGKITRRVGSVEIPVEDLFQECVQDVLVQAGLGPLFEHMSFEVINNDRFTDDHAREMYRPSSIEDIRPVDAALWEVADTACVSLEGPLTSVERLVIELEQELTGVAFREANPQFGTDVKVLAARHGRTVDVTLCAPVKAIEISDRKQYRAALERADFAARMIGARYADSFSVSIRVNTKDITGGAYLTAFGSSLDKGDQGSTGRGNGPLGVNSIERRKSAEAVAGKNPFHHPAKIYTNLASAAIAEITAHDRVPVRVAVTCRNGDPVISPANVFVQLGGLGLSNPQRQNVYDIVATRGESLLADLRNVSERLALADPVREFRAAGGEQPALAAAGGLLTANR
jgi:S-adenosylmethionine synthetase